MSSRFSLDAFAKKLFGSDEPAADADAAPEARHCAAGHVMDPSWPACPSCSLPASPDLPSSRQPAPSVPEHAMEPSDIPPGAARHRPTRIGAADVPPERHTRVEPPLPDPCGPGEAHEPPLAAAQPADTRRITGVLVTYTWQAAGQLFALREGKNYIGAGLVADEGDIPCQIRITCDPQLSRAHALVLCRQGRYDLVDLNSSNGTFINEQMVPMPGAELPDGARIRTGATVWRFLKIDERPPAAGGGAAPEPPEPPPAGAGDSVTRVR